MPLELWLGTHSRSLRTSWPLRPKEGKHWVGSHAMSRTQAYVLSPDFSVVLGGSSGEEVTLFIWAMTVLWDPCPRVDTRQAAGIDVKHGCKVLMWGPYPHPHELTRTF